MASQKEKVQQLASSIRQRRTDPTTTAIKELLSLLVEDVKDNLVSSTGEQTLRLQGEAQALTRLLGLLTKEPPSIKRQGEV